MIDTSVFTMLCVVRTAVGIRSPCNLHVCWAQNIHMRLFQSTYCACDLCTTDTEEGKMFQVGLRFYPHNRQIAASSYTPTSLTAMFTFFANIGYCSFR